MKIKYYLRGLGTGIVLTAILMALVAGGNKAMTDEEIMSRAAKLGMVSADHTLGGNTQQSQESLAKKTENENGVVSDKENNSQETLEAKESKETKESQETKESMESKESTESQETKESMESKESTESQETKESKESKESTESQETKESKESTESQETKESKESQETQQTQETQEISVNNGEAVTITIRSGYSSNVVAKLLADAGLVESASKYDAYLCQNGYDKRICVGVFEITMGSSEEEIAKIITKRN